MNINNSFKIVIILWIFLTEMLSFPVNTTEAGEKKQEKVIVVKSNDLPAYDLFIKAFSENISLPVEVLSMKGNSKTGEQIVLGLRKQSPVLIVALGGRAAFLSANGIRDIPVLFAMVVNWEKYNLRENTNVTGIFMDVAPETQLVQFKMFAPSINKIGVIYSKRWSEGVVLNVMAKVKGLGMELIAEEIREAKDVKKSFKRIKDKIDSFWLIGDPVVVTPENFVYLRKETEDRDIPFLVYSRDFVRKGALLSISQDFDSMGSQAASTAIRIIKGNILPSMIEVERPVGTTTVFNEDTAKKIGLKVDPAIQNIADEIVGK